MPWLTFAASLLTTSLEADKAREVVMRAKKERELSDSAGPEVPSAKGERACFLSSFAFAAPAPFAPHTSSHI